MSKRQLEYKYQCIILKERNGYRVFRNTFPIFEASKITEIEKFLRNETI